jgi:hypothetical protein
LATGFFIVPINKFELVITGRKERKSMNQEDKKGNDTAKASPTMQEIIDDWVRSGKAVLEKQERTEILINPPRSLVEKMRAAQKKRQEKS